MKKGTIAVLSTILSGTVFGIGGIFLGKRTENSSKETELKERFKQYYNLLIEWFSEKQRGDSVAAYLLDNSYKTIAIYGLGEIGVCLFRELENTDVKVAYGIEKNTPTLPIDIFVKTPDDTIDGVDAIIVTPVFAYREIREELARVTNCPIISLEDVIYHA